jgi:small subunit ribosomal protein S21
MLVVKVEKGIEKALKEYKSKIIKTRQISELNKRKEHTKKSVLRRNQIQKARYVQQKFNSNND